MHLPDGSKKVAIVNWDKKVDYSTLAKKQPTMHKRNCPTGSYSDIFLATDYFLVPHIHKTGEIDVPSDLNANVGAFILMTEF